MSYTLERRVRSLFEERTEMYMRYSEGVPAEENRAWCQEGSRASNSVRKKADWCVAHVSSSEA